MLSLTRKSRFNYDECMADQQDLKPELKAIYERIMKTNASPPAKPQSQGNQQSQQTTMNTGTPIPPQPTMNPQQPESSPTQAENPIPMQQVPPTPPSSQPEQMPVQPDQSQAPQAAGQQTPQDSPFSSVPPRSIRDAGNTPFIYSANKKISSSPTNPTPPPPQPQQQSNMSQQPPLQQVPMNNTQIKPMKIPKKGNSLTVIFLFLFLVIYTVFWLIFFKIINLAAYGINLPF